MMKNIKQDLYPYGNIFNKWMKCVKFFSENMNRSDMPPHNPAGYPHPAMHAAYPVNQQNAMYVSNVQPYIANQMQQTHKSELYPQSTQSIPDPNVPNKKTNDYSGQPKCFGFTNASIRRGFIRKVFGILSVKKCVNVSQKHQLNCSIFFRCNWS